MMPKNFEEKLPGPKKQYFTFVKDVDEIVNAIYSQLNLIESLFQFKMNGLNKTASCIIDQNLMTVPNFEAFLPIELPYNFRTIFNEADRTVQLTRPEPEKFLFGNALNTKFLNMQLQRDLQLAINKVPVTTTVSGVTYTLAYTSLSLYGAPFGHRIVATDRGAAVPDIFFEFVLALEFNGSVVPLPGYYGTPLYQKWWAYGLAVADDSYNGVDWAVVVPRWHQRALISTALMEKSWQVIFKILHPTLDYSYPFNSLWIKLNFFRIIVGIMLDAKFDITIQYIVQKTLSSNPLMEEILMDTVEAMEADDSDSNTSLDMDIA